MDPHSEIAAKQWINLIEGEGAQIRDSDIYPMLKNWLAQSSPSQILEIGCGQGVCSDKINLENAHYTGIDPSNFLLDRARTLYSSENRTFLEGSATEIPFKEGTFDAAFSVSVWHLLGDIQKGAHEIYRVLKPGGTFMIITANPAAYALWIAMYQSTQMDGRKILGTAILADGSEMKDTLYMHTLAELKATFQAAHLKIDTPVMFRHSAKSKKEHYYLAIQGRKNA